MHIWYIEHYSGGPGIGVRYRPYNLARAWRNQGHSATIFVASYHHLLEKRPLPEPEWELDGIRYVAVPARPYAENGLSRVLNMWDFTKNLYAAGKRYGRNLQKPDAVIASSPQPFVVFPGHSLAKRHAASFVYEIRDIWPLSITEIQGTSKLHPFIQLCALAERFALKKSGLVASVLPRGDKYLADRGYGSKQYVWVPNGISLANTASHLVSDQARLAAVKFAEWRSQGRVCIIYTGAIGQPNAIDLLLRAVEHGRNRGEEAKCGVVVVGEGEQLEFLRSFAKDKKLSNVYLSGAVPKSDAIALLKQADIGYAGLRNIDSLFGYGISPNKIADYFGASLPVFLPLEPCGDPVSESGGGIARRSETPDAVWDGLSQLMQMPAHEREALGIQGKAYMAREYNYDTIARRYVDAIVASATQDQRTRSP